MLNRAYGRQIKLSTDVVPEFQALADNVGVFLTKRLPTIRICCCCISNHRRTHHLWFLCKHFWICWSLSIHLHNDIISMPRGVAACTRDTVKLTVFVCVCLHGVCVYSSFWPQSPPIKLTSCMSISGVEAIWGSPHGPISLALWGPSSDMGPPSYVRWPGKIPCWL